MRRRVVIVVAALVVPAGLVLAGLTFRSAAGTAAPGSAEQENEPIVHRGATTCGVERWTVKVGLDRDARLVSVTHLVPTNISKMRSLSAPSSPPLRSRVKPVETTVWSEAALLIRVKMEQDSDYHLVLSDTGGRTMIAEIPAPDCVGSSPFLPQIASVRRSFTARFHPGESWKRMKVPLTIWGVGFFDYKHGQSGVAPNAIELHPVLGIKYGSGGSTGGSPTPPPPPPPPASGGGFSVRTWVTPNPVPSGSSATVHAQTKPGASCTASVVYSTGRSPRSFDGSARTAGSSGTVSWSWHVETTGSGGSASVRCTLGQRTVTQQASFTVTR